MKGTPGNILPEGGTIRAAGEPDLSLFWQPKLQEGIS